MNLELDLQRATRTADLPGEAEFERWLRLALGERQQDAEITVRLVDEAESQQLNRDYRDRDRPTNVLSFPFEAPPGIELNLLGDLVICAPVVEAEARAQGKAPLHHWAHMVLHGTLHLLGYDHQEEAQAQEMEALETRLLAALDIPDPYESH
ncbi:rRNA maturation RNase YbeY [Motiliproteus sp. SC1-56]|uniref:rRNA maturation RNase YbeY n=1 Tax=Motiliproteus sp. SC1-56 TaxID=2799565 RepID=UPI001A8D988F|nr:rRNA maturation RNase YbeY [Motiliproteus sp. SC1-56]